MRFDQKLMNYAISEDLTKKKIENCRWLIEKQQALFGGQFTVYQFLTIKSILKTMKTRVIKEYAELLEVFNYYFDDILNMEVVKK